LRASLSLSLSLSPLDFVVVFLVVKVFAEGVHVFPDLH
jgi:hypothetical protein